MNADQTLRCFLPFQHAEQSLRKWIFESALYLVQKETSDQAQLNLSQLALQQALKWPEGELSPVTAHPPNTLPAGLAIPLNVATRVVLAFLEWVMIDLQFKAAQIESVLKIANLFQIPKDKFQEHLYKQLSELKTPLLLILNTQLNNDQKEWLALLMLRMIYSDQRIDHRETRFLGDVNLLLNGRSEMIQVLNQAAKTIDLNKIPVLKISAVLAKSLLLYLLVLACCDEKFDSLEQEVFRKAGKLLLLEETETLQLIHCFRKD